MSLARSVIIVMKKGHLKGDCYTLKSRYKQPEDPVKPQARHVCCPTPPEQGAKISGELKQQVCNSDLKFFFLMLCYMGLQLCSVNNLGLAI